MNDLGWNIFWRKCGNHLNILGRKVNFILPKRTELQRISKDIVKAKHPRALGGAREDRRLELLDLVAPVLVKAVCKYFTVVLRGFAHERGIIPNKINYSVNVSVETINII